jgi:hypothetical protein
MNCFAKSTVIVLTSVLLAFSSQRCFASDYRFFSILAETMRPLDSTIGYDCHEGYLETTSDSTEHSTQYIAQVNLPQGSTVDTVSCYGYDNDDKDFSFQLYRYRFNGEGENVFEAVSDEGDSYGADPGYVDLTVGAVLPTPETPGIAVINNEHYSYGLYLNLPKASVNDLYVVRCVVRANFESTSSFKSIEIK